MYTFMRKMGVERVHMVGQSRGAYLATRLTLEHPEMVRTLVLVDTSTLAPEVGDLEERRGKLLGGPPPDPRARVRFRQQKLSCTTDHISEEFIDAAVYMDTLPEALRIKDQFEAGGEALFNETLADQKEETLRLISEGRLTCPTLIYWGRNDKSAVLEQGYKLFDLMAEANPVTRMVIVNKAGHFHYREYPDEFNRVVTQFAHAWG